MPRADRHRQEHGGDSEVSQWESAARFADLQVGDRVGSRVCDH